MHRSPGVLTLMLLFASPAVAQTDFVDEDDVKTVAEEKEKAKEEKKDGWAYKLTLGVNTSFTHNEQVVGAQQGITWQAGGILDGNATLIAGQHEWTNKLALEHAQTFTEALDQFVKTTDNLEIRSMYLYSLKAVPWLGPFARARLQTQIFSSELVRETDVVVARPDGTTQRVAARESFDLTDPFEPLLLRQSAGMFARPIKRKSIQLTTTLGLGAQEVIADGGFTVGEDETITVPTVDGAAMEELPLVPLGQLETLAQVGVELEIEATGALNQTISYTVFTNFLMPFYTSEEVVNAEGEELEGIELLNTEVGGKLSTKLAKWASLDYVLSAKKIPIVLDAWQVQNQLLLSSAFNLL